MASSPPQHPFGLPAHYYRLNLKASPHTAMLLKITGTQSAHKVQRAAPIDGPLALA
jgi:hypothetical protein